MFVCLMFEWHRVHDCVISFSCIYPLLTHSITDQTLCKSNFSNIPLLSLREVAWEGGCQGRMRGVKMYYINMDVAMKQHGDDNEDKQPDQRPRLHQVLHTPQRSSQAHTLITHSACPHKHTHSSNTHIQVTQAPPGLVTMPSALGRLMLSFIPGRAIPSLLGVSHTVPTVGCLPARTGPAFV